VTAARWGMTVPFTGVPLDDHLDLYRRIEALGYDDIWSAETPNGADGFTTLAMAAAVTERVRLVTGIVNPFTRGPSVLAQTSAAIQEGSGGRFVLGLGASSNVVVERFNGLEFARPLSRVREAVQRIRPALSVPAEKAFGGLRLERPVAQPVPIVLAALRERMLGLAGQIADGAFTNFLPVSGLPAVRAAYEAGVAAREEADAGRPTGLACRFFLIPGDPEASGQVARTLFSQYGSVPVYTAFYRWLGWGERLDPMVEAYASGDRARAVELAPQELVEEIFLFGSIGEIKDKLTAFTEGGITSAVLAPLCPPDQVVPVIEALAP
jgi:probable F420-dependent oxidoreductase